MKIYKVAIVGCGKVAKKHLKAIKKSKELELLAVCDTNKDAANKLLSDVGIANAPVLASLDELISMVDTNKLTKPDIIAITVPSGLHYGMAKTCILNNINVLLEKPMTMSSSEARELYELSKSTGIKIAMGHIYRYFPLVDVIRQDIASGVFGKITHGTISVRWGHGQDYYDSAAWRGTWKSDGGALMNQSIHAVDLLLWLMGSNPVDVTATIRKQLRNIEAEDLGSAIMTLENGSLAILEGTTATRPNNQEACFSIFGEKGSISLGLRRKIPFIKILDENNRSKNMKYIMKEFKQNGLSYYKNATNPHASIYMDFVDALNNDRNPRADALSGFISVDTLMGIYKSSRDKAHVALPLAENFSTMDMSGYFDSFDSKE